MLSLEKGELFGFLTNDSKIILKIQEDPQNLHPCMVTSGPGAETETYNSYGRLTKMQFLRCVLTAENCQVFVKQNAEINIGTSYPPEIYNSFNRVVTMSFPSCLLTANNPKLEVW